MYIYTYALKHNGNGMVHFSSGHKYVESGKKDKRRRKNRRRRRKKRSRENKKGRKKVIDRYLQTKKGKSRKKNDRKERRNEFYIHPYITNGYSRFASHLRLPLDASRLLFFFFFVFC